MYDAMIISDIHLGAKNCQKKILLNFLRKVKGQTKKLIIAGDLFDSFDIYVKNKEWNILGIIRDLSNYMEVIWVKGNHDTHPQARLVSGLINAEYCPRDYIFESGDKKLLVIHGDRFDTFITNHPYLTVFFDWIYWVLQRIDYSDNISKTVKHKSKQYLDCAEIIARDAVAYAKNLKCDIAITGHTHLAMCRDNYFNSGCWTESPSSYLTVKDGLVQLEYFE